jgi:hypothetical protein
LVEFLTYFFNLFLLVNFQFFNFVPEMVDLLFSHLFIFVSNMFNCSLIILDIVFVSLDMLFILISSLFSNLFIDVSELADLFSSLLLDTSFGFLLGNCLITVTIELTNNLGGLLFSNLFNLIGVDLVNCDSVND